MAISVPETCSCWCCWQSVLCWHIICLFYLNLHHIAERACLHAREDLSDQLRWLFEPLPFAALWVMRVLANMMVFTEYQTATHFTIRIEKHIHHGMEAWAVDTEHYQMSVSITCMLLKIALFRGPPSAYRKMLAPSSTVVELWCARYVLWSLWEAMLTTGIMCFSAIVWFFFM